MAGRTVVVLMALLVGVLALATPAAAGQGGATAVEPSSPVPLALTPAEYNNTIADLFGFPRDGERWPARPALADKTGRYLYWPHETPAEMRVPSQILASGTPRFSGIPHQRLLVSVAGAMGLEVDHVGLKHVRGQSGDFIDLSGPLNGLRA